MSQKSPLVRAFDALTFTRNLVLNFIFVAGVLLFLFLIVVPLVFKNDRPGLIRDQSTLYLNLDGNLVERYTSTLFDRKVGEILGEEHEKEILFYDLMTGLKSAKDDPRLKQVYIKMSNFSGGFAQLRELTAAIDEIKKSGKKVIVFADNYNQKQYLVASAASQVYLDPEGSVSLEGLSSYRQYFREALQDKLGVNVHLFRVGEFKSAAEPFIMDHASVDAKEADFFWMSDIWKRYLYDLKNYRGIDPQKLQNQINNMPKEVKDANGNLALVAVNQKLVDGLMTEQQVENMLKKSGATNDDGSLLYVTMRDYNRSLQAARAANKFIHSQSVAVLVAQGEIKDQDGSNEDIDAEEFSQMIRDVREDKNVKALVLRVDSPGGGVVGSEKIRREVELFKSSGRPVVVSMGNTAASGGYWISMNADTIYADQSTVTGSIGIFGLIPNVAKTLDKIGVHTDGVGTTKMAGSFDITKPFSEEEKDMVQQVINYGYLKFINKVSRARDLSVTDVDKVARGRVWSGEQAFERKLVDKKGGLFAAIAEASRLANLEKPQVFLVEPKMSPFEEWFMSFNENAMTRMIGDKTSLSYIVAKNDRLIKEALKSNKTGLSSIKAYAHCECGL